MEEEIPTVPFQGRKHKPAHAAAAPAVAAGRQRAGQLRPRRRSNCRSVFEVPAASASAADAGAGARPSGKERAKAEKCLANAIYFEARNEPVRGQIAVAQVVLNRVFSPYYPETICGVVYPERAPPPGLPVHLRLRRHSRRRARERPVDPRAEASPSRRSTAQIWLPEVGKSTHYHATYVRPRWIRDMRKIVKHGQHIFYRPHRWGNGEDEAGWGVASLHAPDASEVEERPQRN